MFVQILIAIVSCISIYAENQNVVPINVVSGFDDNPILVGVVSQEEDAHSIQWSFANTREFSVEIPERTSGLTLVLLKRDSIPVVKALTSESLAEAITIEFSEGKSVSGTVVAAKDGIPIPEGLVTVEFDDQLGIPIPEKESVFAWELEEGGTFEIRGLPRGVHTVSVRAPGYMPAEQQIQVDVEGQPPELHFQLTKAHYLRGRIVDWLYKSTVEGTFDVVVSPPESQTAEMRTEFDAAGNFQLGPFAEGAVVELVVNTESNLRSRPIEIAVPADDVVIEVYKWIRVLGTVQDQESGNPIPEYSVLTGLLHEEVYDVVDENGQFYLEICENQNFLFISVLASNYSFWTSESIRVDLTEEVEFDLGVIPLKRAYTVRGRVLERGTLEPIEGANVYRDEPALGTRARGIRMRRWFTWNQRTTTDSNGAFELSGFPEEGSTIVAGASGFTAEIHTLEDVNVPIEIELEPTGSISGQVVSITGEPVAAMISFGGGGTWTEDGNFHFKVRAGTHRYRASSDLGTSKAVEVTVESGQSVEDVRLVIENIGRVFGTITGLLENETITIGVRGATGAYEQGLTNGAYEVFGVPEGHYEVRAETSFGREMTGEVVVDETLEGQIDFTFTGSFMLSGRLLDGSRGLAGYSIDAKPSDPSLPVVRTNTIRDGSFRFVGLVDGNYQVEVPMHDFTQQVLVHGDTYSDLHVHAANRLSGKVLGRGSVEGAEVWLIGGEDGREISFSTTVRENGSYLLKGIPTGTYTLKVTHPKFAEVTQQVDIEEERVKLDLKLNEVIHEPEY